jgi:hypothetical protein
MPRSFSGIQRQALSLYRRSLRAARAKDRSGVQEEGFSWQAYARAKFEEHRGLKPIRDHMVFPITTTRLSTHMCPPQRSTMQPL